MSPLLTRWDTTKRLAFHGKNYGAFVHNAYLLVAVETGYFGLAAFVIMLLRPMLSWLFSVRLAQPT